MSRPDSRWSTRWGPETPTRPCAASSTELPSQCLCCSTARGMSGGETFVEDASDGGAARLRLQGAGPAGWTQSDSSASSTSGFSSVLRLPDEPMVSQESLVRIGEKHPYCAAGYPCWGRWAALTGAVLHTSAIRGVNSSQPTDDAVRQSAARHRTVPSTEDSRKECSNASPKPLLQRQERPACGTSGGLHALRPRASHASNSPGGAGERDRTSGAPASRSVTILRTHSEPDSPDTQPVRLIGPKSSGPVRGGATIVGETVLISSEESQCCARTVHALSFCWPSSP